jgi:hypothetical protein
MGGWDDDTAVQRKAQLRLLSSLPALRLQNSAERADASGITHHPVPEVRRSIRRDGWPETHQHLLSAALPAAAYTGVPCQPSRHCPSKPRVSSRRWILVALGPDGRPDFNLLQNFRSAESRIVYYAFDILVHEGQRLTALPLLERRAILSGVIEPGEHVALSQVSDRPAAEMLRFVKSHSLEGAVAKRSDSVYQPGQRTGLWSKYAVARSIE